MTNVVADIEWAAWTQAVMSAASILISVYIVNRQHRSEVAREAANQEAARRGRLSAIESEIQLCSDQCEVYVAAFVESRWMAPGYRLPLVAFGSALPALLQDGAFTLQQSHAVSQFYVDAEAFNRGLDRLGRMQIELVGFDRANPPALYLDEAERTLVKALHLIPQLAGQRDIVVRSLKGTASRYDAAMAAVRAAKAEADLGRVAWWQRRRRSIGPDAGR